MSHALSVWLAWFIATMFYAYQYILRVLPNIGISNIQEHFSVGAAEIGSFSGIYYIGYTLMHIPIGILIDRIGVRIILPICIAMTSVGLISLIYSDVFLYATLGRLIVGIASSASVLGIFKVVQIGFGEKKFAKMVGISVTIGLLGAMYGGMPLDNLIRLYGWHTIINFFIIFGFIFAVAVPFFLPRMTQKPMPLSVKSLVSDIKILLLNPRIIILSLIGGLMVGPVEGFADGWGTLFFQSIYEMDRKTASILPSMIFFGMCFGCIIIGYFTEKTQMHIQVVVTSVIAMLTAFIMMLFFKCSISVLYCLTFIIGFASSYQLSILSKVREFAQPRFADLSSATANMIMMIFGSVFHNSIGYIIGGQSSNAVQIQSGLSVIPIALAVSLLIILILRKTVK